MKKTMLICMALAAGAAGASDGTAQECRVLVAKEWIVMGTTSLDGCLRFADEAASPDERQFAKLGDTYLKVQAQEHFQSRDGGNTWEPLRPAQPDAAFTSLNVLQPPDQARSRSLAPDAPRRSYTTRKHRRSTARRP